MVMVFPNAPEAKTIVRNLQMPQSVEGCVEYFRLKPQKSHFSYFDLDLLPKIFVGF